MNVFVLCTGRSGSTTFHRACRHVANYTSGHELNTRELGPARLHYPENHIEVDNRLSWLLGRLDETFGDHCFYVHLLRDEQLTAESFDRRWAVRYSIIRTYAEGVLRRKDQTEAICLDCCRTVNANITQFLRDKTRTMTFRLEESVGAFPGLLEGDRSQRKPRAGAEGVRGTAQPVCEPRRTGVRPTPPECAEGAGWQLLTCGRFNPKVYTSVEDSGVLLTLRFICPVRQRRGLDEEIWETVLERFGGESEIDFAYPTTRLFRNYLEGKEGVRTKPPGTTP